MTGWIVLGFIVSLCFAGAYEEFHHEKGYGRARSMIGGFLFSGIIAVVALFTFSVAVLR